MMAIGRVVCRSARVFTRIEFRMGQVVRRSEAWVGFGVSIFLITLGAIFKFAIKAHLSGVDLPALGVILMIVGAASFVLQLFMMNRQPKETASPEIYNDEHGSSNPPHA